MVVLATLDRRVGAIRPSARDSCWDQGNSAASGCGSPSGALGRGLKDTSDEDPFESVRHTLWSGWLGGLAHPGSPAGGAGPGGSSQPGPLGRDVPDPAGDDVSMHPLSPAVRLATLDLGKGSPKASKRSKGSAPTTQPKKLKVRSGGQEVNVVILDDARTDTLPDENGRARDDTAMTRPRYSYTVSPTGRLDITVSIQTTYARKAHATDTSAYGRGTTDDDKNAGNTTLGFHEQCHREDFIDYLQENPVPTASSGAGGMRALTAALKDYFDNMESYSLEHTDETGTTKTEERRSEQSGSRAP